MSASALRVALSFAAVVALIACWRSLAPRETASARIVSVASGESFVNVLVDPTSELSNAAIEHWVADALGFVDAWLASPRTGDVWIEVVVDDAASAPVRVLAPAREELMHSELTRNDVATLCIARDAGEDELRDDRELTRELLRAALPRFTPDDRVVTERLLERALAAARVEPELDLLVGDLPERGPHLRALFRCLAAQRATTLGDVPFALAVEECRALRTRD